MKMRDLKKVLDNLTEEQLDGEFIAKGTYWDGVVADYLNGILL